jgi:hypothetical protein
MVSNRLSRGKTPRERPPNPAGKLTKTVVVPVRYEQLLSFFDLPLQDVDALCGCVWVIEQGRERASGRESESERTSEGERDSERKRARARRRKEKRKKI